jgi:hypothetical protein
MTTSIQIDYIYAKMVALVNESNPMVLLLTVLLAMFLGFRILQRMYYISRGHVHYVSFDPRKEMDSFIKKNNILYTEHSFICKRDKVSLRYRRLGNGSKIVLLNNGVGTDFNMWLPTLKGALHLISDISVPVDCSYYLCTYCQ